LYGNDIDEETTPLEAGLGFVVKLKKGSAFIGKDVLERQKAEGVKRKRVGLKMVDKGPSPRPKLEVWKDGAQKIGYVTSGTFSPLLKMGVAQAYVGVEHAVEGTTVVVKVREKALRAEVSKFPLYDATKYGHARVK
jgi:aminomethyltransferase